MQVVRPIVFLAILLPVAGFAKAHDIPNQRVDRAIQVMIQRGNLLIDYEVSLTELTLTQDLRSLIGSLPGGDRSEWLELYGTVTGPLNARGFLVTCDGRPVPLEFAGFHLELEEHPRYTFRLEGTIPETGRLRIVDTNYASSEGTSRLAIRAVAGVAFDGDELPGDVEQIPIRPVWQLTDAEERRTKEVEVEFRVLDSSPVARAEAPEVTMEGTAAASPSPRPAAISKPVTARADRRVGSLSELLDPASKGAWMMVALVAAGLGAIHAIQPGHGKSLVSAIALGPAVSWHQPALLAFVVSLTHTASVLLIAAILWASGGSEVEALHRGLVQAAGFVIAAGGFWRIGRALRGGDEPGVDEPAPRSDPSGLTLGDVVGLGVAGGLVPCWDAVGLLVLSAAIGRLETGVVLVLAFGLGMAVVLIGFSLFVARFRGLLFSTSRHRRWESRLSLLSGLLIAMIGLAFFLS